MNDLDPRELLESVYGKWAQGEPGEVLSAVRGQWRAISARFSVWDAETCRQAALAAARSGEYLEASVWRARALSRFVAADWREGAIAVLMVEMYRMLSVANSDYPDGKTLDVIKPCPEAVEVIREIRPFTEGEGSGHDLGPDPELIARFFHEKLGFLLVLEERYDEALDSYRTALDHVSGEQRGQIKVSAGIAQAEYLRALSTGGHTEPAIAKTDAIASSSNAREIASDIAAIAEHNVHVMLARDRALKPYEIL